MEHVSGAKQRGYAAVVMALAALLAMSAYADEPRVASFEPTEARFVRVVVHAVSGDAAVCIDELEVYAPDSGDNLALAARGAKASASSCLQGNAKHTIEHLNDGTYGNSYSWIAATPNQAWAQIELPKPASIAKVVVSRDREGRFNDRIAADYEVQVSANGADWTTMKHVTAPPDPGAIRDSIPYHPGPPASRVTVTQAATKPEVFKKDPAGFTNLALLPAASAKASSLIPGYRKKHNVEHLNDGKLGNDKSWVSERDPSWAEIDLGAVHWVYRVVIGSDASGKYDDRAPVSFSILTATEHADDSGAPAWREVWRQIDGKPVHLVKSIVFEPVQARWVRVAIDATNGGTARIDELQIFGQTDAIAPDAVGPLTPSAPSRGDAQLRYAFLTEEHAWLKAYGRADLDPGLVPYNGRVKEYPRHVGDDRLPLPELNEAPVMDGRLDDAAWARASRGVTRVAHPHDFDAGPLVEQAVSAGIHGDRLYLGLELSHILSKHVAVVSTGDWQSAGVLKLDDEGLAFVTYDRGRKESSRTRLDAAMADDYSCIECALPLELIPSVKESGLTVGLGLKGRHVARHGRPVTFAPAPFAVAQAGPCVDGVFPVRITAGTEAVALKANAPGLDSKVTLQPGEVRVIKVTGDEGPIGPQYDLTIEGGQPSPFALHLFRYDPLARTLDLARGLVQRLAYKGVDMTAERAALSKLRKRHGALMAMAEPDFAQERQAFFDARKLKREALYREPDLDPIERLLFVKRMPFEPSHNYSTCFDARYRPGGSVAVVDVPREDGRFIPEAATVTDLFESGGGIARNPMADFDAQYVYFGYRPSEDGYYHIMRMRADGSEVTQLTDGPFHDYWPCPLPDGGVAFIATRCKSRALCWRPQAAVLFRMEQDGSDIQPLSLANLTEWSPSVMSDGRIIWMRWEYLDKGADFGHTLWAIRPDGSHPELVFGNDIIQPNGYANGREVPGTNEICCTLISHFGDLNGPIALLDIDKGRFNPDAITSITPEVPWPGMWPRNECFRDPVPLARDYFLCSHSPRDRFALYIIDRYGNRELLYDDPAISSMCPTVFRPQPTPPVLAEGLEKDEEYGEFFMSDVYKGISPQVKKGDVKYVRVVQEVRSDIERLNDGRYREDHPDFLNWYASPVDAVNGPYGWPAYVAKAPLGLVPVEEDGSARFRAPAGKVLYFQILDKDYNELQRMRSVVHLQPGEKRSCIGCHEHRQMAPPVSGRLVAMTQETREPEAALWGGRPFSFEEVVQPVLNRNCVKCHDANHDGGLDFTGTLDAERIPTSYRTLITKGLVHYVDCGWNSGGFEKFEPMTFGTMKSQLWQTLNEGHKGVKLSDDDVRRLKTWIDMNCPLWPDYIRRQDRPGPPAAVASAN